MEVPAWYNRFRVSWLLGSAVIGLGLGLATLLTYASGGTKSAFPHLFYVPVVAAGFLYRTSGGFLVGIVAGILAGPLMPKDTDTGMMQSLDNWLIRLAFFVIMGTLVGWLTAKLYRQIVQLQRFNDEVILAFVRAIDAKDTYTAEHSLRVAGYAVSMAQTMGLSKADVGRIRMAALLHDVGKISIPNQMLNKRGPLSTREWRLIRQHPVESVKIIGDVTQFKELIPGIRHHHEWVNGTGYPDGVAGEELCLDARIITVADAFEAMTSERSYRRTFTEEEALHRLQQGVGVQFDAEVVNALLRVQQNRHSDSDIGQSSVADS